MWTCDQGEVVLLDGYAGCLININIRIRFKRLVYLLELGARLGEFEFDAQRNF